MRIQNHPRIVQLKGGSRREWAYFCAVLVPYLVHNRVHGPRGRKLKAKRHGYLQGTSLTDG
jgi:hypothetical protein